MKQNKNQITINEAQLRNIVESVIRESLGESAPIEAGEESLVYCLQKCAEAHNVEFGDYRDGDGDDQVALMSLSVPLLSDVRSIVKAFSFNGEEAIEPDNGWGTITIYLDDIDYKQSLSPQDVQQIEMALPAGALNEALSFGRLGSQIGSGWKTLVNKDTAGQGFGRRLKNTVSNFKRAGNIHDMEQLVSLLKKLMDQHAISPNETVAQLIGGDINGNKMGHITGKLNGYKSQVRSHGGKL